MNHQSNPSSNDKVLKQIAREFCRFREEVGGHPPEALRSMATSAVGMGLSNSSVAVAAGVSPGTIRNWLGNAPRARRLELVSPPETGRRETSLTADSICIRLVSGVEIDFPRSGLSVEFLAALNSIGSSR